MNSSLLWLAVSVLWLWVDCCDGLTGGTLLSDVLYSFGGNQGDSVVAVGDGNCQGPINIPVDVFASSTLFVSATLNNNVFQSLTYNADHCLYRPLILLIFFHF